MIIMVVVVVVVVVMIIMVVVMMCMGMQLYYHELGTAQSADVLVLEFPDKPLWLVSAEISDDDVYLMISISESCEPVGLLFGFFVPLLKFKYFSFLLVLLVRFFLVLFF